MDLPVLPPTSGIKGLMLKFWTPFPPKSPGSWTIQKNFFILNHFTTSRTSRIFLFSMNSDILDTALNISGQKSGKSNPLLWAYPHYLQPTAMKR